MRQRVELTPFVREAGLHPEPVFDTNGTKTLRARVRQVNKRMRSPSGEEVMVSSEAVIHSPEHVITSRDQIELPDGTKPPIVSVTSEPDHRGKTRVYKVAFGGSRRAG